MYDIYTILYMCNHVPSCIYNITMYHRPWKRSSFQPVLSSSMSARSFLMSPRRWAKRMSAMAGAKPRRATRTCFWWDSLDANRLGWWWITIETKAGFLSWNNMKLHHDWNDFQMLAMDGDDSIVNQICKLFGCPSFQLLCPLCPNTARLCHES